MHMNTYGKQMAVDIHSHALIYVHGIKSHSSTLIHTFIYTYTRIADYLWPRTIGVCIRKHINSYTYVCGMAVSYPEYGSVSMAMSIQLYSHIYDQEQMTVGIYIGNNAVSPYIYDQNNGIKRPSICKYT